MITGTTKELRALDYFRSRTAIALSSYFDGDFWSRLVLQVSHAEPAIKHAMIAVGTLHEQREQGVVKASTHKRLTQQGTLATWSPPSRQETREFEPFALDQYNKAIYHVSKKIAASPDAADVALLACVLFVCLEFLRGDIKPALKHFQAGMGIARALRTQEKTSRGTQSLGCDTLPFFYRLEILSSLFGNNAKYEYPVDLLEAVPERFDSLVQARSSMVHLMNLSIRFIRSTKHRPEGTSPDYARRTHLMASLEAWKTAFDGLSHTPDFIKSTRNIHAANVLHIHRCVTYIWIKRVTREDEMSTDEDISSYHETVVSMAETIQLSGNGNDPRQTQSSTFVFDMEIVSPLYYIGVKCRNPGIRRRAINVLRSSVRREGLWDSYMAATIAERVMEIEEAGLSTLDGSELPPDKARLYDIYIDSQIGLIQHELCYFMKPEGKDRPMQIWKEQIIVRP